MSANSDGKVEKSANDRLKFNRTNIIPASSSNDSTAIEEIAKLTPSPKYKSIDKSNEEEKGDHSSLCSTPPTNSMRNASNVGQADFGNNNNASTTNSCPTSRNRNNESEMTNSTAIGSVNHACSYFEEQPRRQSRRSRHSNNDSCRTVNNNNVVAPYVADPYSTFQHSSATIMPPLQPIYSMNANTLAVGSPITKKSAQTACKLQMFRFLEVAIKRILFHLAKSATQHKLFFRVFPLLITLIPLVILWFIRHQISFSKVPFHTFYSDSQNPLESGHHQTLVNFGYSNYQFNGSNPAFDMLSRTSPYEFSVILSTRNRFDSVLSHKMLDTCKRLLDAIHNISVTHLMVHLEWHDMCREQCGDTDDQLLSALQNHELLLKYPEAVVLHTIDDRKQSKLSNATAISNFSSFNRVFLANFLGDVELDADGIISKAHSMRFNIKLKESLKSHTLLAFENLLRKILNETVSSDEKDFTIYFWSYKNYVKEVIALFKNIHWKLIGSFLIFIVFAFLSGFLRHNSYKNRPIVALHIGTVITFACLVAYAMHIFVVGGEVNVVVFPSAFVLISVAFLQLSATQECFNRYSMIALHPAEKLAFIYSWDMPCFFGAAVVVSGAAGITSFFVTIPYLRQALLVFASGGVIVLIFGLSYLTVFWYNSEKREASGLKWFQFCRKGDESFNNKYVFDYDELICNRLHEKLTDLRPSFTRFVGRLVASYNFRLISVGLFTIYLVFAGMGCWTARQTVELHEEHFIEAVDENSATSGHNNLTDRLATSGPFLHKFHTAYPRYEQYLELVFELPVDYYNRRNKDHIFSILHWALEQQYATKAISWLTDFERFQKSSIYDINQETIAPVISYVFLKTDPYRKYSTDIVFDRFQTNIVKSRMYLELNDVGMKSSEFLIKQLEKRAKDANLPMTVNAPFTFLPKHDREAIPATISGFLLLNASMTALSFILFTFPIVFLCVPLSSVVVLAGVCGFAQYFYIPLNIVTLSTALMGNLFTATAAMYFCYMFSNCGNGASSMMSGSGRPPTSSVKRVEYAFQCTLLPISMACVISAVAYLPLLLVFSTSASSAPVLWHVWKVLALNNAITFMCYCLCWPTVASILTDFIGSFSSSVGDFCDNNGCCVVEQPVESIYYVSSGNENPLTASTAIASFPASRLTSYYGGNGCMMNGSLMLPPAYDYRQRMLMAPPPIVEYPMAAIGNGYEERVLCAERLFAQCSPACRRTRCNGSGGGYDRYLVHDANSNCNSLDSRGAKASRRRYVGNNCGENAAMSNSNTNVSNSAASSRHQTPRRNRRTFVGNSTPNPSQSPRVVMRNGGGGGMTLSEALASSSATQAEQIYEEPESPVPFHPRRKVDNVRNNDGFPSSHSSRMRSSGPSEAGRHFGGEMAGDDAMNRQQHPPPPSQPPAEPPQVMQPSWRQYLLSGQVSSPNGDAAPHRKLASTSSTLGGGGMNSTAVVSSPSSGRRKYNF